MLTRRHQVFVSSTLEDLEFERQRVWQNLVSMNYLVAGMETFPATTGSQLDYIRKQIAVSDYVVLIIAGRYGSVDADGVSFTEREFELACELGVPVLCFAHRRPDSIPASKTERGPTSAEKLREFRARAMNGRTVALWESADELALAVLQSLQNARDERPRPGWVRGDEVPDEARIAELETLRRENVELRAELKAAKEFAIETLVPQRLTAKMKFSYFAKRGDTRVVDTAQVSLVDVLREMSVTETPNHEVFDAALRGAISRNAQDDFENVEVAWEDTDRVILRLAEEQVLGFSATGSNMRLRFGPQWIAAHALAKRG